MTAIELVSKLSDYLATIELPDGCEFGRPALLGTVTPTIISVDFLNWNKKASAPFRFFIGEFSAPNDSDASFKQLVDARIESAIHDVGRYAEMNTEVHLHA